MTLRDKDRQNTGEQTPDPDEEAHSSARNELDSTINT